MFSSDIVITNITLRNSPFWTLHPYDCKNVTIRNVTILAPIFQAPNTDGIDPDSCEDMIIEDCYISVGDDGIAIKSGWDQYGIAYGRPSRNIIIRNLVITYRNLTFDNVRVGIVMKTDYNEHPDGGYDPKAVPVIRDISFTGIHGQGVRVPVRIHGSEEIVIRNVTFQDMSVGLTYKKKHIFQCAFVEGRVIGTIFPAPCENLDRFDEQGHLVRRSASPNSTDIDYDF
ncbi:Probable polygalacturonase [Linum perenne]